MLHRFGRTAGADSRGRIRLVTGPPGRNPACVELIPFARVSAPLKSVFNNLTPVVISRGVVNLSTYVDNILASLLPTGAVAALNYGQLLYMMPISLFCSTTGSE